MTSAWTFGTRCAYMMQEQWARANIRWLRPPCSFFLWRCRHHVSHIHTLLTKLKFIDRNAVQLHFVFFLHFLHFFLSPNDFRSAFRFMIFFNFFFLLPLESAWKLQTRKNSGSALNECYRFCCHERNWIVSVSTCRLLLVHHHTTVENRVIKKNQKKTKWRSRCDDENRCDQFSNENSPNSTEKWSNYIRWKSQHQHPNW